MIPLLNQIGSVISPLSTTGSPDLCKVTTITETTTGYRCRFVPKGAVVYGDPGRRLTTTPMVYLPKFASVRSGWKFSYSSTTYLISSVQTITDQSGHIMGYLAELEVTA